MPAYKYYDHATNTVKDAPRLYEVWRGRELTTILPEPSLWSMSPVGNPFDDFLASANDLAPLGVQYWIQPPQAGGIPLEEADEPTIVERSE